MWTLGKQAGVVFVIAVVMQVLDYRGCLASAEGIAADRFLRFDWERSRLPRIVTVTIDDHYYNTHFEGMSPLDPRKVMPIVGGIRDAGAFIVGVDLLTESADYAGLVEQRPELRGDAFVWAAAPRQSPRVEPASFPSWLIGGDDRIFAQPGKVLGQDAPTPALSASPAQKVLWGIPVFPVEEDRAIRRVPRVWQDDGTGVPVRTFAAEVRRAYCEKRMLRSCDDESDEVFVSYRSVASLTPTYTVEQILDCREDQTDVWTCSPKADSPLKDAIVLLGGTFSDSRDFFDTAAGRIPGLILNAHAVQAFLHGPAVTGLGQPAIFFLDVIIGLVIVLLTRKPGRPVVFECLGKVFPSASRIDHERPVTHIVSTLIVAIVAALLSIPFFFWLGVLWVSWAGMLLTSVPSLVEDLLHHKVIPEAT